MSKVTERIGSPCGENPFKFYKMYAIVEINGQQFKAEEGKKLFVHHIVDAEANATVEFDKVLLVDNNGTVTVGAPAVEGAKVVAEVVSPLVKGDKVLVFHKKRRKGYRKLNGHRQQFSEILIKSVIA
jgi:large subunit ribosomal protein L21